MTLVNSDTRACYEHMPMKIMLLSVSAAFVNGMYSISQTCSACGHKRAPEVISEV